MSYIKSVVTNSDSVPEGSTNLYWTNARFDTRFASGGTFTGNLNINGGTTTLGAAGFNLINWGAVGLAAPTMTSRSNGTKVVLWNNLDATHVDFALGIESGALWRSVPQASTSYHHKWYGGTTELMRLNSAGLMIGSASNAATQLEVINPSGSAAQIAFGNTTNRAFLHANSIQLNTMYGAYHDGTNYIAKQTQANIFQANGATTNDFRWCIDTGLTLNLSFTPTERMRLTASGLVIGAGIAPNAKLETVDSTGASQIAFGQGGSGQGFLKASTSNTQLFWGATFDGTNYVAKQTSSGIQSQNGSGIFWYLNTGLTVGSTFTPTEVARLTTSGIGIGMAPAAKLDVNGVARVVSTGAPTSGSGVEIHFASSEGTIQAFDRTAVADKVLNIRGSAVNFKAGSTIKATVDSSGLTVTGTLNATNLVGDGSGITNLMPAVTVYTSDPATLSTANQIVVINKTVAGATTVTLPASPAANQQVTIKDGLGDSATNNITINGNGKTIDGSSTKVISTNYNSYTLVYNGTQWNIL
jgi:hypothetical protein